MKLEQDNKIIFNTFDIIRIIVDALQDDTLKINYDEETKNINFSVPLFEKDKSEEE